MKTGLLQQCTVVVAVFVCGCANARHDVGSVPTSKAPSPACAAGTALPETLLEAGSVVLFGEIHGVQELPSLFGEAVCTTAASGLPVEVGLEVPGSEQASIDFFLASPGSRSDVEALVETPFWKRDFQDGRSSQAMLALLERLRALGTQGLPIHVFVFDLDSYGSSGERDKAMAGNLAAHVRAHPEALTMVLTGEVHSWKTQGTPWDRDFLPMGWHLVQEGVRVRALGRSTPAGTAWVCTSASASECKQGETRATAVLPSGRTFGIELLAEPSARGYDGLYGTPSLTASPPAQSSVGADHH